MRGTNIAAVGQAQSVSMSGVIGRVTSLETVNPVAKACKDDWLIAWQAHWRSVFAAATGTFEAARFQTHPTNKQRVLNQIVMAFFPSLPREPQFYLASQLATITPGANHNGLKAKQPQHASAKRLFKSRACLQQGYLTSGIYSHDRGLYHALMLRAQMANPYRSARMVYKGHTV